MIKTHSIFGLGSTPAQVICLFLLLGLSLVGVKSNGLAQSISKVSQDNITQPAALSQEASLNKKLAALRERLQTLDDLRKLGIPVDSQKLATEDDPAAAELLVKSSQSLKPAGLVAVSTASSSSAGATAISNILLKSLESTLETMKATADQERQSTRQNSNESAAAVARYVNEKIKSLDRIIKLLEQKQSLQDACSAYQKQLHDLRSKVEGSDSNTSTVAENW